jgi:agmatinase
VTLSFLEAEDGPARGADVLIAGVPIDGGVSFRPGAALAPDEIRRFSDSIESWSPRAKRDMTDLRVVDCGNVDLDAIPSLVATDASLFAFLGGDHSITPKLVSAVAARFGGLALVGFDAHLDFREEYPGDHACTYRRITEAGVPCHVFGPRSGERSEWDEAPRMLAHLSGQLDVATVLDSLAGHPVYVTLDIDVLDPSVAPGTGNPEAGGPGFNELLEAIEALAVLNVVAFDVVEVSPPLDPSGITQAAAALLVREMILNFAR